MSYEFEEGKMYMMPVHFGPAVTPRNNINNERFIYDQPTTITNHTLVYESDPTQLEKLLPPGFTLTAPYVVVNMNMLRNLAWLAGNGYNLVGVAIPAEYKGQEEKINGRLLMVMWENHADPILTGREQLGYSKIFCDISDIATYNNISRTKMSSWGFQFCEMTFDKNQEPENLDELKSVLNNPKSDGIMHYKYFPRTGDGFSKADVQYVCLNPSNAKLPDDVKKYPVNDPVYCKGTIEWRIPTWEQMPTQHRVVEGLGGLEIKRYVGAVATTNYSLGDLYSQRIIK